MVGMAAQPSSKAPVKAVSPVGRLSKLAQAGRQHQDADETQHHRREARQDLDQRFEDLVHPGRGDFGHEDGGCHPKGHGDEQRATTVMSSEPSSSGQMPK